MYNREWLLQRIYASNWLDRWRYDTAGRRIVHGWYEGAVFNGRIKPIEQLSKDEKQEYWNEAIKCGRGREESIQIAKVIYYLHCYYESQAGG